MYFLRCLGCFFHRLKILCWVDMILLSAKSERRFGKPLCLFWTVWKVRSTIAFYNDVFSLQKLKREFVCFLWSESKLFVDECQVPRINTRNA